MLGISFVRILRNALRNFQRNIWLSLATMIIMTLTLLMMSFLYFINVLGGEVLRTIEQKVDLSVIIKEQVTDEQLATLADDITAREDVAEVRIITSEQALEIFRERHADDPFIQDSLKLLEDNPLPASIFVMATDPRHYQNIARHLESERYAPFIEEVKFEDSRLVIDRLIALMTGVRNFGFVSTVVLSGLVILIMFNTIRLAIYSFREEIDIMRLVGASNWFIRGPFIVEAILVALLSVAVSSFILYPLLDATAPHLQRFFFDGQASQFNLYAYATSNWMTVIGLQSALAVGLAVFSSMIAIRRYLRN
jgi:cell division transport system permease protein